MSNAREAGNGAGSNDLLPRSIFVPEADSRKNLRDAVDSILSDKFMLVASISVLPIILLPFLFDLPQNWIEFLGICDWSIILVFVAEYTSKLYLARDRWAHFKEPWHLVDLFIVVLPFVQYLPALSISTSGSPSLLLRLLRLPRAVAVGGRALGSRMKAVESAPVEVSDESEVRIRVVDSRSLSVLENLTWDDLRAHLADPTQEWIDIHNLSAEGVRSLSSILKVPEPHFRMDLVDEIFPHIDYVQNVSLVFLQSSRVKYPDKPEAYLTISRTGVIVICVGPKVITVSRKGMDFFEGVVSSVRKRDSLSFVVSVLYGVIDLTLTQYRTVLSEIQIEVDKISGTPRSKLPRDFLVRAYGLNKQISRLISNLVRRKDLLAVIESKEVPLEGFDTSAKEELQVLQDEVSYLNEIAADILGNLRSTIDLYINQTGFETNRILKILAVITSMAVIPTAVSGLLGMNLLDVPYTADLWEVVLVIVITMTFVTYVFIRLGWLKG